MAPERTWTQRAAETRGDLIARVVADLGALRGANASGTPRLTNADVLALLASARTAAQSTGWYKPAPFFPEGWYEALGYRSEGDKFDLSAQHRTSVADPALADMAIQALIAAAIQLDEENAPGPTTITLWNEAARYRHNANLAWDQLQKERQAAADARAPQRGTTPPLPIPAPGAPIIVPPVEVPLPDAPLPNFPRLPTLRSSGVAVWLVVGALIYFGSKRKR